MGILADAVLEYVVSSRMSSGCTLGLGPEPVLRLCRVVLRGRWSLHGSLRACVSSAPSHDAALLSPASLSSVFSAGPASSRKSMWVTRKDMALSAVSAPCLTSAPARAGVSVMNLRRYLKHSALVHACSAGGPAYSLLWLLRRWSPLSLLAQLQASTVAGSLERAVGFLAHKKPVSVGGRPTAGAVSIYPAGVFPAAWHL